MSARCACLSAFFHETCLVESKQAKALDSPEPVWNTPVFKLYCNSNYKKILGEFFINHVKSMEILTTETVLYSLQMGARQKLTSAIFSAVMS